MFKVYLFYSLQFYSYSKQLVPASEHMGNHRIKMFTKLDLDVIYKT